MRILAFVLACGCVLPQAAAVEWQDDFDGGAYDQQWDFFADDGSINPPSQTDTVLLNDALEILGRDDFANFNLFVAGLVGLTSDPGLAFPDAVQITATIEPTTNFAIASGFIVQDNSDVFLMARSEGASAYVLALDRYSGSFDLVRSDDGVPDNIAPGMIIPDFDRDASYILRLTAEGTRIRGEVFDTSMNLLLDAYATDSTYSSGFAGVGAAINNDDSFETERTYVTGRFDDVLATDENIVPMQPFFPSHRLDMRTPTSSGLNAVAVRDLGLGDIESVRWAINGLMAAAPEDRHEGTIASFDIHDPDNGATVGDINSPQQPILTDMPGDDNDFIQLLSGSFEIADGDEGDYTFNVHTDDGFAMRLFYDGPGAGEDLVNVPFTKIGANGLITSDGGVAVPHGTGDSNVQAAVTLDEGTYSYEVAWFEIGGGAFAEVSTAAGDFVDNPGSANWVLLGDAGGLALIDGLGTGPADGPTGIPGDYSGNGLIEQADLDLVLGNWGAAANDVPGSWINDPPEGFVDQAELDKVLGNWGAQAPGLGTAAGVPEPATLFLLAIGLAAGWALKRRS
jgi:hypothetical protein